MTFDPVPIAFFGSLFLYLLLITAVVKISEWRTETQTAQALQAKCRFIDEDIGHEQQGTD